MSLPSRGRLDPRAPYSAAIVGAFVAVLGGALALRLMPPPGGTADAGLSGLPRFLAYAAGGSALALTAARCLPGLLAAWRPSRVRDATLATGLILGLALTAFNVVRLRSDIADPFGPPLWLAAMLGLLVAAIAASLPVNPLGGHGAARPWPAAFRSTWPLLLLLALLAYATAIRFYSLATIPLGINPDEGDRASTALDVLDGSAPTAWFDSGWFFINMVYFRLLALSLRVFGPDIAGGRTASAIAGSAFLIVLAWLACRHFGWRIGLVTVALATASGISLQNSRLIAETIPTALLWVISIGCFLEGARTGRPWAFASAGLCGGLGLYFYPSARLWAAGAALTVLLIWLQTRRGRELILVRGFAVAFVGAIVAAAPFLVHLQTHPIEVTGRYTQTAVVDPHNQERLSYLTPPEPLPRLLALQAERTLGMFDRYPDGGGFLPTGKPLFPPPLAALALLAMVFGLVRAVRDVRLSILVVWLGIGLSGVLVTVETPDMIRAVGMLPSLFVLMAVVLVELVDRFLDFLQTLRPSGARAAFGWLLPIGIGALVISTDTSSYFSTFRDVPSGWGPMTSEGQVVAQLGQTGPVYSMETNEHAVTSGWVRMLAPHAERGRIPNPGRELPVLQPTIAANVRPQMTPALGQAMNFLMSPDPNQHVYLDLLYRLYPGGWLDDAEAGRRSYAVSPEALARTRGVLARSPDGRAWPVDRFGEVPPELVASSGGSSSTPASSPSPAATPPPPAFPASPLAWSAGVLMPTSGEYAFQVTGPATVRVDGIPVQSRFLAARGVHYVELLGDPAQPPTLLLGGVELGPRETYRLMDAPWGLLGHVDSPNGAGGTSLPPPTNSFLDATVAMAFFEPELGAVRSPNRLIWTGTLLASTSGTYRMAFAAEDPMHLELDGRPIDVVTLSPDRWMTVGQGSPVPLTAGPHQVQITLDITHGGRELARWNWIPPQPDGSPTPGDPWSVVPPMTLRPEAPIRPLP